MIARAFIQEVVGFLRINWWVAVIYFVVLVFITVDGKGDVVSVICVTSLHFAADILIMMMLAAYSRGEYGRGSGLQVLSALLFLSVKVYTGLSQGQWHYIMSDPIYAFAAFKNYRLDVHGVACRSINGVSMFALSLSIVFGTFVVMRRNGSAEILSSYAQWLQMSGIFLFAVALSITGNQRRRHLLSLVALVGMVGGSAWETICTYYAGDVVGLALSYALLPLTVLIFYIQSWPTVMATSERS